MPFFEGVHGAAEIEGMRASQNGSSLEGSERSSTSKLFIARQGAEAGNGQVSHLVPRE